MFIFSHFLRATWTWLTGQSALGFREFLSTGKGSIKGARYVPTEKIALIMQLNFESRLTSKVMVVIESSSGAGRAGGGWGERRYSSSSTALIANIVNYSHGDRDPDSEPNGREKEGGERKKKRKKKDRAIARLLPTTSLVNI